MNFHVSDWFTENLLTNVSSSGLRADPFFGHLRLCSGHCLGFQQLFHFLEPARGGDVCPGSKALIVFNKDSVDFGLKACHSVRKSSLKWTSLSGEIILCDYMNRVQTRLDSPIHHTKPRLNHIWENKMTINYPKTKSFMRFFPVSYRHADVKVCRSTLWTSGCQTRTPLMKPFVCCRGCYPRHPPTPPFWRSRPSHANGTSPSATLSGKLSWLTVMDRTQKGKVHKSRFSLSIWMFLFFKDFSFLSSHHPLTVTQPSSSITFHRQQSCDSDCEKKEWALKLRCFSALDSEKLKGNDHGMGVEGNGRDLKKKGNKQRQEIHISMITSLTFN